ncbi:MAG TPA: Stk1 family PASTA domain-containing Ser/Thr kinase [Mycobacteriales bacterium]|nr:Stk1 family PASTA domain-containing Ser/Thr kinase [Mycobacteriales bacterium]
MTGTALADPLPGTVLDRRYRIDAPIARGGMSTVYAGTDLRLDRQVAVKVMAPALAHDPAFTERFVREARTAARLSHPNAVAVFDQGAEDTRAGRVVFLVMELVPGSTLREVLHRRGRLRPDEAVSVLEPVLAALAAAHRAGLVHRDVKPENVLVSADGTVKVVDFGLARAVAAPSTSTQSGMVLGTVAYVSPEQVARGVSDARTDVYSAGVVLFELLTGTPPYGGDSALAVAYRHVHDDVPAPSTRVAGIPPALDELVLRATRREPGGRPADAGVFLAELAMARTDLGLRRVPSREVASASGIEAPTVPAGPGRRTGPTAPALSGPRATTALPAYAQPVQPPGRPRRGASRVGPADGSGWPAERRRRRTWSWVALAVVLLAALSVGTVAWWFGSGRFAAVPSLTQLTRAQAEARLDGVDLTGRFDQEPSETVAAGRVVRSEPAPGGRVLRGHSVTVVLSSGPPAVPVPSVTGRSADDAQGAIRQAGLQPQLTEQSSADVEAGQIISQTPAGGTAKRGSTVALVVSTGPGIVAVPDVRGLSIDDARQKLSDAGFRVKVRSLRIGNVIAQSPRGGSQREQGSTVTIYGI